MIQYLPAKYDKLTGLLSPWWRPLRTRGPRLRRWRQRGRFEWAAPSFHPERGARWLVPLPADAVMFVVDIVDFKAVNDTHGLPIGDAMLVEVGRRVQSAAALWPVYRYGGDEFLVIARLEDLPSIEAFGRHIRQAVERPMTVSAYSRRDIPLSINVRITFARATTGGDLERLRSDLDAASLGLSDSDPSMIGTLG